MLEKFSRPLVVDTARRALRCGMRQNDRNILDMRCIGFLKKELSRASSGKSSRKAASSLSSICPWLRKICGRLSRPDGDVRDNGVTVAATGGLGL